MILLTLLLSLGGAKNELQLQEAPAYNCTYCQPEQIHIAFGEKTNDIVVTWSTFNDTEESVVLYGADGAWLRARGGSARFAGGGGQWVHRVTLPALRPAAAYEYHCGSKFAWSERFSFKTPPEGQDWVVSAAIFGDLGVDNAQSLPYLQEESERDMYHFVLHVGDFAYDMDEEGGRVGDQFMRQIQPIAAIVPYMTVPGNHENYDNFTQYKSRFSMPLRAAESMFYSWDVGPVHFVGVNTEAYYFPEYGTWPLILQFDWLQKDLAEASKPENRAKQPWIILYAHKPMYCSNSDPLSLQECAHELTRSGIHGDYAIEPLLKQYGVDIVIWAHEHSYERTFPLYDGQVYNGTADAPYVNPGAPVHLITGSAGCRARVDPFVEKPAPWSAFRSSDYGYTRFLAYNRSHVYFEQVSVDKQGEIIDSIWVVKDSHGPYHF